MRSPGTAKQLARRRDRALKLLEQGKRVKEVVGLVGASERSVRRWRQEAKQPRKKSLRSSGKPSYLTVEQIEKLKKELLRGAYAHGYAEDYWTLERIGHVIWELFRVRYVPSGVWRLLQRMGWSSQKPQRLAIQRDEDAIVKWKGHVLPRIKKAA